MNIAIIGSGPTGSLAAISLASIGCRVDLYERLSDETLINKSRAYAITHSSRKFLEKCKLWDKLVSDFIPFQSLNVVDSEINKQAKFSVADLNRLNQEYSSIGWIVDHQKFMSHILETIRSHTNINKIPTSIIPNTINYDLIVAADGAKSSTKKRLNIPSFSFNYDQVCITAKVLIRGINYHEAFEILTSEGPFAVLPLGGDLFQIICSTSVEKNLYLSNLPSYLFLDYLATILPYGIEPDMIIDEPKSFPIQFLINYSLFSGKYIFVGESAHVLHPVAGQGLNLCWRDVNTITNIVSISIMRNKSKVFIPIIYSFSRFIDIVCIAFVTDGLVRFSRNNSRVFFIPRQIIFLLLKKFSYFRTFILNILTNGV